MVEYIEMGINEATKENNQATPEHLRGMEARAKECA